jgi:hypothetical protein
MGPVFDWNQSWSSPQSGKVDQHHVLIVLYDRFHKSQGEDAECCLCGAETKKENQMTYREHSTSPAESMEQSREEGLEVLPELIRMVINTEMLGEREGREEPNTYRRQQMS